MKFHFESNSPVLFVRIEGNLMGDQASEDLIQQLDQHLGPHIHLCAINLSGVGFMNSTGIGIVVNILTKMRNRGGEVVLVSPSEQVQRLLQVTKLDGVFKVQDSETEVLASA